MTNFIERSFLLALGAAVLAKETAESAVDELVKKGDAATGEGKKLLDETVEQARQETRTLRNRIDETVERNFRDMGLVMSDQLEELKLKVAQLEHRISLLESGEAVARSGAAAAAPKGSGAAAPADVSPEEVAEEYHHLREEEAEAEALNPHLDVP